MTVRELVADRRRIPKEFNRVAGRYDVLASLNPGYDARLRLSAKRLKAPRDALLLDLCCGTGRSTAALLDTYPDATVVGVDASEGMLKNGVGAMRERADSVPFVLADAVAPALMPGSFDGVFMAYGLRNVGDKDASLRTIFELLAPDGRLALHEFALTGRRSEVTWAAVTHSVIIPSGWLLSGSAAIYRYLYESVRRFDRAPELLDRIRRHGFTDVDREDMPHWEKGITHTFTATRPGP